MGDIYLPMILSGVLRIELECDSSPMRIFGLGRAAGSQEILVKSARLVDKHGNPSPFAPQARAPCVLRTILRTSNISQ